MRDVEAVRQEATLLKEQMHTVKEDIKKVSFTEQSAASNGGWLCRAALLGRTGHSSFHAEVGGTRLY